MGGRGSIGGIGGSGSGGGGGEGGGEVRRTQMSEYLYNEMPDE